ncbi:hypothetical protein Tco_1581573, partial [Tanacetum coccineum]
WKDLEKKMLDLNPKLHDLDNKKLGSLRNKEDAALVVQVRSTRNSSF